MTYRKRVFIIAALLLYVVMNITVYAFTFKDIKVSAAEETVTSASAEGTEEKSESFAEKVAGKLSGLPDELVCFVISMVPIIELRGGLIVAAIKDIPLFKAVAICITGNLVPIPFILLLITPIFNWLKTTKLFKPLVEKLEKKSLGKSEKIKKYEFLGLVLFVGIPLPGTGAWTGSLIASLLNIKIKKAFPAICLGLLLATVIMCIITYAIPWLITNVF
jgi:uncharacterized membrane protein